tara:strand:+ start:190 stop:540 length:351 start_codon:yes stop_codon:yes gene_type:complete
VNVTSRLALGSVITPWPRAPDEEKAPREATRPRPEANATVEDTTANAAKAEREAHRNARRDGDPRDAETARGGTDAASYGSRLCCKRVRSSQSIVEGVVEGSERRTARTRYVYSRK